MHIFGYLLRQSGALSVLSWRGRSARCRWFLTTFPHWKLLKLSAVVALPLSRPTCRKDISKDKRHRWTELLPLLSVCARHLAVTMLVQMSKVWGHIMRPGMVQRVSSLPCGSGGWTATPAESFSNFSRGEVVEYQRHQAQRPLQRSTLKVPECHNGPTKLDRTSGRHA